MSGHQKPYKGNTDVWLTPPDIIKSLGPFDLDPCSPAERPWDTAAKHYTIHHDGLAQSWDGTVWLNPPYGSETGKWLKKLAEHNNGFALVFARTETEMFHRWAWDKADAMLFLAGRLHFHHLDGSQAKFNAGAPSVIIAYGVDNAIRLKGCGIKGKFVSLKDSQ